MFGVRLQYPLYWSASLGCGCWCCCRICLKLGSGRVQHCLDLQTEPEQIRLTRPLSRNLLGPAACCCWGTSCNAETFPAPPYSAAPCRPPGSPDPRVLRASLLQRLLQTLRHQGLDVISFTTKQYIHKARHHRWRG